MPKKTRRTRFDRQIVSVFSDTHAGHDLGLMSPKTMDIVPVPTKNQDGKTTQEWIARPVNLTPYQSWLWHEVYTPNIKATFDFANGDPVTVVHNGDLSQGVKYIDKHVSVDTALQMFAATANLMPWFEYKNLKAFRVIWGTDSHIFGDNSTPRIVTEMLKKDYPKVDIKQTAHSLLDVGGVLLDIAHHGPSGGIRNWTEPNMFMYYTRSLMADAIDRDMRPPDAVIRSHFHRRIEGTLTKFYAKYGRVRTWYLLLPSYQGMNGYARQRSRSADMVLNGHVDLEIINGVLHDIIWRVTAVDQKTYEVL